MACAQLDITFYQVDVILYRSTWNSADCLGISRGGGERVIEGWLGLVVGGWLDRGEVGLVGNWGCAARPQTVYAY